jgi:hypothetical protein
LTAWPLAKGKGGDNHGSEEIDQEWCEEVFHKLKQEEHQEVWQEVTGLVAGSWRCGRSFMSAAVSKKAWRWLPATSLFTLAA